MMIMAKVMAILLADINLLQHLLQQLHPQDQLYWTHAVYTNCLMKKTTVSIFTWVSIALLFGFVALYIYISAADPIPRTDESGIHWPYLSLGNDVHLTITKRWGGNVIMFNKEGPYIGATVITMSETNTVSENGWNSCGVSFHLIRDNRMSNNWWTLAFSPWYPIIIFGILPAICLFKRLFRRKIAIDTPSI